MDREQILLTLKLIAATSEKLANDYEKTRLSPDDLVNGVCEIQAAIRSLPESLR